MTDANNTSSESTDDERILDPLNEQTMDPLDNENDWLLGLHVKAANRGAQLGITLFVSGTVVTGTLISTETYFDMVADWMEEANATSTDPAGGKGIADAYRSLAEDAAAYWLGDAELPIAFIHLADARVFVPGQSLQPQEGTLWRGLLKSVSGFAMGTLNDIPKSRSVAEV